MREFLVVAFACVVMSGWPAQAAPLGVGCDTSRTAVAFHSDGSPADQPGAPVPCAAMTQYGGAESRMAVAPDGGLMETPAIVGVEPTAPGQPTPEVVLSQNAGIGWSQNGGASWNLVMPDGTLCPQGDNDLYFDRVTSRLFYSCIQDPLPPPAERYAVPYLARAGLLSTTPPSYDSWYHFDMNGYISENPRFTSAPAPAGQPQPIPGENMTYWCANFTNLIVTGTRTCHRSFDGGASWEFASILYSPVPLHAECGTDGESLAAGYPQGGPDGSLWAFVMCGDTTYLARSTDEAATWPILRRPDDTPVTVPISPGSGGGFGFGNPQLRVDRNGNLYVVEKVGNALLLRVSRDDGLSWSEPLDMVVPAARSLSFSFWGAAIGYEPGHVAVSYMTPRSGGGYDGYISATHDALDPNPVFYAAAVNPPTQPIVTTPGGFGSSDDFITLDMGPDGTPWAPFFSDCRTNPQGDYEHPYCQHTDGLRITPAPPFTLPGNVKTMTVGSLQWLPEPSRILQVVAGAAWIGWLGRRRRARDGQ
jgi:hypothetical protein